MEFIKGVLVLLRNKAVFIKYHILSKIRTTNFPLDQNANFVISVASYPNRIHLVPAVFEALSFQTVSPKHAYLVLSEEEWPNLKIPSSIEKLVHRGIQIVWVKNNPFAVKVIVPILLRHPDMSIIPLDDDLIYGKKIFESLVKYNNDTNGCIIGHVGKVLYRVQDKLKMTFRSSGAASLSTDSSCIYFLKGSGTIYKPGSLDPRVTDLDAINRVVPGRGADIWLWAAAIAAGTRQICLGSENDKNLYIPIPIQDAGKPKDTPGEDIMEQRFQMAIDFFGIRQKLLQTLPNREQEFYS